MKGLYKQVPKGHPNYNAAVWWADFTVNGQRFRISTGESNKTKANAFRKKKELAAGAGKLSAKSQSFARLTFTDASDKYIAARKLELQASSLTKEKQLLVKLKEYFGGMRLNQIDSETILDYREQRATGKKETAPGKNDAWLPCGAAMLNQEIGVLRRVLKRGKLWHPIADDVRPLREPETIGRALTPEQKATLVQTAALKPEWETAYFAAIIALNTTMRPVEIRGLRWSDIDLLADTLTIRKSKTAAGVRVIPLTRAAVEVFAKLRARAETFGEVSPEHYVFARFKPVGRFENREIVERGMLNFDPTTPLGSWKKAWRTLTTKAGLNGLRFYDLRHHAITELCENGVPEQTIKAIAGWNSRTVARMLNRYSHHRLASKREALNTLEQIEHVNTLNGGTLERLEHLNMNMNTPSVTDHTLAS
jgi:integrase